MSLNGLFLLKNVSFKSDYIYIMHDYIVNPETGRRVSILGKTGQNVLKRYAKILNGGSIISKGQGLRQSHKHKWTYGRLERVKKNMEKITKCKKINISEIVSECGVTVLELIEIKKCFKWMDHTIYTNTSYNHCATHIVCCKKLFVYPVQIISFNMHLHQFSTMAMIMDRKLLKN